MKQSTSSLTSNRVYTDKNLRKMTIIRQEGFTLIEIIVVILIIGLLYVFLTGGIFSQGSKAKVKLTEIKMAKLQTLLGQYQFQNNTFPPDLISVTVCNESTRVNCPPAAEKQDILDAWDNEFGYAADGNGTSYTLKSFGEDRKEGGTGVNADLIKKGP
jgi:general secretion pathway protein G